MLGLKQILIVALGGAIGSVARYKLGGFALHHTQAWNFPVSTFSVNIIGCFVIGFLSYLAQTRGILNAETRTLVFIGIIGGFTTFSAFGNETMNLWRDGQNALAALNIAAHLVLGLGAVWIGRALAYQIWR